MAQHSIASKKFSVLPAVLTEFLRRRLVELGGITGFALALLLALALASYSAADPAWNVATSGPTENLLGAPGAHAADIILQTFGVGGWVLVLCLTAWAWRVFSHRGVVRIGLTLALLPVAMISAAALAAVPPAPEGWPLAAGLGGWIGESLRLRAAGLGIAQGVAWPYAYAAAVGTLSALSFALALGLEWREWRSLGRAARAVISAPLAFARPFSGLARRESAPAETDGNAGSRARHRREPHLFAGGDTSEAATEIARSPRVSRSRPRLRASKRAAAERQEALDLGPPGEFRLPPLSLLCAAPEVDRVAAVSEDALEQNARLLEAVLDDFGVSGSVTKVRPGPVITLYELEPAPGTKTSRVIGLSDDIARSMSAVSVRAAVVPGRDAIGIELPNARRETVYLRELLATADYENSAGPLALALGKNIAGAPVVADLSRMPHLLIAGTTGSGKSVAVNTMILSLLYRLRPDQCKFIMIDPKMLELSAYDGIPHLLTPVVTDPGKAVVALKWTVREMETRYRELSKLGVRNIASYNQRLAEAAAKGEVLKRTVQTGFDSETGEPIFEDQPLEVQRLPHIVVVVDEMADLMLLAGKEIEGAVQRLSQMARAAGIHLIMATQRPSVDVITGTIKANFPTRISFQVTSKIDSRTILGEQGAEQLLGSGDMLYMASGGRLTRVHGPYVMEEEVDRVVAFLKEEGSPDYLSEVTEEAAADPHLLATPTDELYDEAVAVVCRKRKASTSFLQRHLQIGYNRAARIIECMEAEGVISAADHVGKREVLARDTDALD
jgi:S-DNA-T family DNA segregation ATPase FtsK/SpoIIIE